jgi:hypothetical protein
MTLSRLRRAALSAAIAVAVSLLAQSPATMQTIEFEVASVKLPMPRAQPFFGIRPGGRFSASSMSLLSRCSLRCSPIDSG